MRKDTQGNEGGENIQAHSGEVPFDPAAVKTIAEVRALSPEHRLIWDGWRLDLAADKLKSKGLSPDQVKVSDSGSIYNPEAGRGWIVANPGGGVAGIDGPGRSLELRQRVMDGQLQAKLLARQAVDSLVSNSDIAGRGWHKIVAKQAEMAVETELGRTSTEAARFVGSATGYTERLDAQNSGDNASLTVTLPASALVDALKMLAAAHKPGDNDVIDAQSVTILDDKGSS